MLSARHLFRQPTCTYLRARACSCMRMDARQMWASGTCACACITTRFCCGCAFDGACFRVVCVAAHAGPQHQHLMLPRHKHGEKRRSSPVPLWSEWQMRQDGSSALMLLALSCSSCSRQERGTSVLGGGAHRAARRGQQLADSAHPLSTRCRRASRTARPA